MANPKNWAITDLSGDDVLTLTINGVKYDVAQFTASWSLNEVPTAACLVAIGRDARSQNAATPAKIHTTAANLKQMLPAQVTFTPKGEYATDGRIWPGISQVIFDGYYTGMGYRKVQGKAYVILNLVHWLVDLGFSSTLSVNSHPTNPTQLTAPAIIPLLQSAGASGEPIYAAHHLGHEIIRSTVESDLWLGIKNFLCALANVNKMRVYCGNICGGNGTFPPNDRALKALKRIEGGGDCASATSLHHLPLALETKGISLVTDAVASAITEKTLESFANVTFWDTLIGDIFPMFNMAIVPLVDTAVVIADTPGFRTAWKTINPSEAEVLDSSGLIPRPLHAVAVYGDYESITGVGQTGADMICVGGCWVEDANDVGDGVTQFVKSPAWLRRVSSVGVLGPFTSGVISDSPSKTATTIDDPPEADDPVPADLVSSVNELYKLYAHSVYMTNMLRGRNFLISGKLRFDIAPGSIVEVLADPELFLPGVDSLAETVFGSVYRVTVSINAEARLAGTSFHLVSVRSASENKDDRTSIDAHPLFGANVFKGAPLVDAFDL